MQFLNPAAFWFLPLVLIPIIVHFFSIRKPEKLAFSSVLFIEELQKTTVRKLKLKDILLLLVRMLVLIVAILVFAQPMVSDSDSTIAVSEQRVPVFVIENGMGTDRVDENGPVIDQLKQLATERIKQLPEDAELVLLTSTGQIQLPVLLSPKEALQKLQKIEMQPKASHFISSIKPCLNAGYTTFSVFSDKHFDKWKYTFESEPLNEIKPLPIRVDFIQLGSVSESNVFIRNIQLENQVIALGKPLSLRVDVSSSGQERSVNLLIRCVVEDQIRGEYQFNAEPGSTQSFQFEIKSDKTGFLNGYVEIQGDVYPSDNSRAFVISVPDNRTIGVVTDGIETSEELVYMRALFAAANSAKSELTYELIPLSRFQQSDAERFSGFMLLGLKEIPDFITTSAQSWLSDSKGMMVIPSAQSSLVSYNQFFSKLGIATRYTGISGSFSKAEVQSKLKINDVKHPIIQDLFDVDENKQIIYDAPNIFAYLRTESTVVQFSTLILKTEDDAPLLLEERIQRGKVLISTIGMGSVWSSFSGTSFFAPFWYKTGLYITASSLGGLLQHELGKPIKDVIVSTSDDLAYRIQDYSEKPVISKRGLAYQAELSSYELTPSIIQLSSSKQLFVEKGLYLPASLSDFKEESQEKVEELFSQYIKEINVYDVNVNNGDSYLQAGAYGGITLWPYLVMLTLVLLLAESVIAVWFKVD